VAEANPLRAQTNAQAINRRIDLGHDRNLSRSSTAERLGSFSKTFIERFSNCSTIGRFDRGWWELRVSSRGE
jgi:hypothetical protein